MASVHTRETVLTVDGKDISMFCKSSDLDRSRDTHDNTTYGRDAKTYAGGLPDGSFSAEGFFDSSTTESPRAVLTPLLRADAGEVPVLRQLEGPGNGKSQDLFDGILKSFKESAPVADIVMWTCEFQVTGEVDTTPQGNANA